MTVLSTLRVTPANIDGAEVRWLTIDRAAQRNPLDMATVIALRDAVLQAVSEGCRAVAITGGGEHFSAGGDLKKYRDLYQDEIAFTKFLDAFAELCDCLENSPLASVAVVNGTCVAGGLELALAADVIVVAEDARVGDGHLRFAQLPGAGGSQRLPRAIPLTVAKVWLLSGDLYSGSDCVRIGLAAEAVPSSELYACATRWLAKLTSHDPDAYASMKQLIRIAKNEPLERGLERERDFVRDYVQTPTAKNGLVAFAERRKAQRVPSA